MGQQNTLARLSLHSLRPTKQGIGESESNILPEARADRVSCFFKP
jgi:hypothetical protein